MIMVLVHSTLIEIATSVLKLFVGQGSVTDGRTKRRIHPSPFSEFAKKKLWSKILYYVYFVMF